MTQAYCGRLSDIVWRCCVSQTVHAGKCLLVCRLLYILSIYTYLHGDRSLLNFWGVLLRSIVCEGGRLALVPQKLISVDLRGNSANE